MTRRRTLAAAVAATMLLGGAALITRNEPAQAAQGAPDAAPEVPVAEVVVRQVAPSVDATGTIAAVERADVRARVSGFIEAVGFEEGGLVRRGQVLYQLDPRPFRANLARARAELLRATEHEALATLKLKRGDKLVPGGVISDSAHDLLRADAAQASAAVAAARAAVQSAELTLGYTRVVSPISGRAGQALIKAGNLVSGGTDQATLLTTVVSTDPVHVQFDVDEPIFRSLAAARKERGGKFAPGGVFVALANEHGFPHSAEIDFLAHTLDISTGTAQVRAVIANQDGALAPGLFARVRVHLGEPHETTLVTDKAVHTDQEGRYVLVATPEGVIEQRHVQTGTSIDGLRVIRSGIAKGERVVLSSMVRPGMQVKARLVAMAGVASALSARSKP
jgi:gold/copper resistance efflux system membrane fusion protein